MMKILIADDHAILRRGLMEILMREFKDGVYGEAENAEQVLAEARRQAWDLVILDVSLPGRSGFDVLADLKRLRPKLPVLVLSMHPEGQYGKRVLKAGAAGYLHKDSAPEELLKAVRKVVGGGRYVSAGLAEKLALELEDDQGRPLHETLSPREFEVLRMIALGRSVTQIAEDLHLGGTTVSTYRARLLEKMKMRTTAELMHYALRSASVEWNLRSLSSLLSILLPALATAFSNWPDSFLHPYCGRSVLPIVETTTPLLNAARHENPIFIDCGYAPETTSLRGG